MIVRPLIVPNTPIGEILKAAGSEGIVLESEDQGRLASPVNDGFEGSADSSADAVTWLQTKCYAHGHTHAPGSQEEMACWLGLLADPRRRSEVRA